MKDSRLRRRITHAKKRARPELRSDDWDKLGYCTNFIPSEELFEGDDIERVDVSQLSKEEFVRLFEARRVPVILTGLTRNWKASSKWTIKELSRKYRNQRFKCGEDDDGYSVKLKMKYFVEYMRTTKDDCPLYLFDSSFGERHKTKRLLHDYSVPSMFEDDLFRYASEKRRPPYRWLVVGPARSGTGIHIDPLGTSAWNALIYGHKKWCLVPPETPKELVKPREEERGKHPDEATTWFKSVYPRIRSTDWPAHLSPINAIQRPGDIVFVPNGWWHVVLNLDTTVAITHNFCSLTNLPSVWRKTLKKRPNFAKHWLRALRANRPEVFPILEDAMKEGSGLEMASSDDSSSSSSSSSSYSSDSEPSNGLFALNSGGFTGSRKRKRAATSGDGSRSDCSKYGGDECAAKVRRSRS